MTWLWTDDIARALIERGVASSPQVEEWIERPFAIAVDDGRDPFEVGEALLGLTEAGAA
jgi:hypothetical protein